MFSFFRRRRYAQAANRYVQVGNVVAKVLHGQKALISDFWLEDERGRPNGMALGYMFGFADCALQLAGLDIRDTNGHAMLLALLNEFAPGRAGDYCTFLTKARRDLAVVLGILIGGNQYRGWKNSKGEYAPVLWATCFRRTGSNLAVRDTGNTWRDGLAHATHPRVLAVAGQMPIVVRAETGQSMSP